MELDYFFKNKLKLKNGFESVNDKIIRTILSCKTNEQLCTTKSWIYNLFECDEDMFATPVTCTLLEVYKGIINYQFEKIDEIKVF